MKPGMRFESQVCETQVIVTKPAESLCDLRAGGVPMVPMDSPHDPAAVLDPAWSAGTAMGKRYVEPGGAEVLVTRSGAGSLSVGQTAMTLKEAKPLPASD